MTKLIISRNRLRKELGGRDVMIQRIRSPMYPPCLPISASIPVEHYMSDTFLSHYIKPLKLWTELDKLDDLPETFDFTKSLSQSGFHGTAFHYINSGAEPAWVPFRLISVVSSRRFLIDIGGVEKIASRLRIRFEGEKDRVDYCKKRLLDKIREKEFEKLINSIEGDKGMKIAKLSWLVKSNKLQGIIGEEVFGLLKDCLGNMSRGRRKMSFVCDVSVQGIVGKGKENGLRNYWGEIDCLFRDIWSVGLGVLIKGNVEQIVNEWMDNVCLKFKAVYSGLEPGNIFTSACNSITYRGLRRLKLMIKDQLRNWFDLVMSNNDDMAREEVARMVNTMYVSIEGRINSNWHNIECCSEVIRLSSPTCEVNYMLTAEFLLSLYAAVASHD